MPNKKLYRVIITVLMIKGNMVQAWIGQWKDQEFEFPLDIIPTNIREKIKHGSFLLANADINADDSNDLNLCHFEFPLE